MVRFALRLPDEVHSTAERLAHQDNASLNEWIIAAIERESIRRGLAAHNEYVKTSPSYSIERWQAQQDDIDDAIRGTAK